MEKLENFSTLKSSFNYLKLLNSGAREDHFRKFEKVRIKYFWLTNLTFNKKNIIFA